MTLRLKGLRPALPAPAVLSVFELSQAVGALKGARLIAEYLQGSLVVYAGIHQTLQTPHHGELKFDNENEK